MLSCKYKNTVKTTQTKGSEAVLFSDDLFYYLYGLFIDKRLVTTVAAHNYTPLFFYYCIIVQSKMVVEKCKFLLSPIDNSGVGFTDNKEWQTCRCCHPRSRRRPLLRDTTLPKKCRKRKINKSCAAVTAAQLAFIRPEFYRK